MEIVIGILASVLAYGWHDVEDKQMELLTLILALVAITLLNALPTILELLGWDGA